jgi:O-antigen/teichoic acid export membrane protein
MTNSILARTALSAGWVIGWRMATRLLGLASTLLLVRLLLPEDFGVVALGAAFAQTVDAMSALGTDDALIREREPTRALYDTAFTLNAMRGVLTGAVVTATAWPTAVFFGEPRLTSLLLALAALAVVDGWLNIGVVDFRRDFQFHKEFLLNILPRVASVGVTVAAAVLFQSYWALIAGQATFRVLRVVSSYRMHPYRPRFSLAAWRRLLLFSAWAWALTVVQMAQERVDAFVIGRSLGTGGVGAYALGFEIATLPTSEVVDPLGRAAYSGFSATRREGGTHALFNRLIASSLLIAGPAGLGLSMVADPLVRVALGERWLQVVPVIQVLSLACGVAPFGNLAFMVLRSYGYFATICAASFCGLLVKVAMIRTLLQLYGLPGAAGGAAAAMTFESLTLLAVVVATQRLPVGPLIARCWRVVAACAVMTGTLWLAGLAWTGWSETFAASALRLLAAAALGAGAYAATLGVLWSAQGRPDGAEADMMGALRRLSGRVRRNLAFG